MELSELERRFLVEVLQGVQSEYEDLTPALQEQVDEALTILGVQNVEDEE